MIEGEHLVDRAAFLGTHLLHQLTALAERHPGVSEVRGRGLMCALTLPSGEVRDETLTRLRRDERVLMLGCGPTSLRVRPALTVSVEELDRGVAALDRVLSALGI